VSICRNRGTDPILAETAIVPTTCAKGATKRSKRVAQRLANEEPAPPPLKLPKLHLVLTRKEIQEDWMKITGHKYSGKPKKSTLIQRVCPPFLTSSFCDILLSYVEYFKLTC
jgi:hypothetical protein